MQYTCIIAEIRFLSYLKTNISSLLIFDTMQKRLKTKI